MRHSPQVVEHNDEAVQTHNRQVVHLSALTSRPWLTCFKPGITATLGFYHWSCCPGWCSGFWRHCSFVS